MSNELTTVKINLPSNLSTDMALFDDMAKGADFLPRLQLITSGKYVNKGKISPGHWGVPLVGGEDIEDLGTVIDVLVIAWRPKAMDVKDKSMIIVNYDPQSDEFKRIATAKKQPGETMTNCMWGPTFLVYERSTGKFYEMFMSNASGRQEAGKLKPFLPDSNDGLLTPARLSIRYKEKGSNGWHVPVVTKCTMPFETVPTEEEIFATAEKFMAAKSGVEKVEDGAPQGRAR